MKQLNLEKTFQIWLCLDLMLNDGEVNRNSIMESQSNAAHTEKSYAVFAVFIRNCENTIQHW